MSTVRMVGVLGILPEPKLDAARMYYHKNLLSKHSLVLRALRDVVMD